MRYSFAILAIAMMALSIYFHPVMDERAAFLLFLLSIIQVAFWQGLNAGIFAISIAFIVANVLILFPHGNQNHDLLILNLGFGAVASAMLVTASLQKKLSTSLWQSRRDLEHAQAVGQIGNWRLDLGRNELYWSDEIYFIFGIPKGTKITYESFLASVHPDDRGYVDKMWSAALLGQAYDIEHRVLVDGQLKWLRERAELEFDSNGNLLAGFGTSQDITGQKIIQLELEESRQWYQAIIGSMVDAVITVGADQRISYFNAAAENMFGCKANQAVGLAISGFIPDIGKCLGTSPSGTVPCLSCYGQQNKMGASCSYTGIRFSGQVFSVEASISLNEFAGEQLHILILRDITERKLAEAASLNQERELRLLMDATPALIAYIDTGFHYVRVNSTYQEWFGKPERQIVGSHVAEIIGDTAWQLVKPYLERARLGEKLSFELQIPYKNKSPRWVHGSCVANLDAAGQVQGIVIHVFDIGAIKRAQNKISSLNKSLRRKVHELQVFFDTVPVGLSIAKNGDDHQSQGNLAIGQLFGSASGAGLATLAQAKPTSAVMLDGSKLAAASLPMQCAMAGEIVSNQILDIVCEDGNRVTVLANASPLYDEHDEVRGAVGAFLDVTAITQAEKLLKQSQSQLRLFVEQAPVCMAMLDRNMNYLVTSRRWLDEFGRGHTELLGLNHYLVIPDMPIVWRQMHEKALAGQIFHNDEELWVQADGAKAWLRRAIYPWTNEAGEIGGIIVSCENITARRKVEEELRNTEAQLALVVEQVKAGYWVFDLDTQALFMSPELQRQVGLDENSLLKGWNAWLSRLHPDDRMQVVAISRAFISGQQDSYELEFRLRHTNNTYRWLHSRGALLHDSKSPKSRRMLGICLDATEYRQQQETSKRREQMEKFFRLNVAVQTAAAIAHKLNQPLAAITAYADVALYLLEHGNPDPQKLSLAVKNCTEQAQRAGLSIRQLLTLLQKEEGACAPVDVNALVIEAVGYVKAEMLFDAENIALDLAGNLPKVFANDIQIQKVLLNLLRNGLESMQEAGRPGEAITVISRTLATDPSMVEIIVCDQGAGVANNAALRDMFQPFYTSKPDALGMGLAVSKALVEAHFGTIWAEHNPKDGFCIHFTLPVIV